MPKPGDYFYVNTKDQQAKFISNVGEPVTGAGINDLYNEVINEAKNIDVLKLDVEGTEYFLLSDKNFQPIPRQISVEFHLHCHADIHNRLYARCMDNLLKYYRIAQHEMTQAHGAGWNYWNSLFIRKDLI